MPGISPLSLHNPPPPSPSFFDGLVKTFEARYNFKGNEEQNELSFNKGEKLLLEKEGRKVKWFVGKKIGGAQQEKEGEGGGGLWRERGLIPGNYVVLVDEETVLNRLFVAEDRIGSVRTEKNNLISKISILQQKSLQVINELRGTIQKTREQFGAKIIELSKQNKLFLSQLSSLNSLNQQLELELLLLRQKNESSDNNNAPTTQTKEMSEATSLKTSAPSPLPNSNSNDNNSNNNDNNSNSNDNNSNNNNNNSNNNNNNSNSNNNNNGNFEEETMALLEQLTEVANSSEEGSNAIIPRVSVGAFSKNSFSPLAVLGGKSEQKNQRSEESGESNELQQELSEAELEVDMEDESSILSAILGAEQQQNTTPTPSSLEGSRSSRRGEEEARREERGEESLPNTSQNPKLVLGLPSEKCTQCGRKMDGVERIKALQLPTVSPKTQQTINTFFADEFVSFIF